MQSVASLALTYDECCGSAAAGLSHMVDNNDFLHDDVTGVELMDAADVHNSGVQPPDLVDVECSERCLVVRGLPCVTCI